MILTSQNNKVLLLTFEFFCCLDGMRKLIEDEILKATTYDELPKSITNILTKADYRQQAFNGKFGQQNCG